MCYYLGEYFLVFFLCTLFLLLYILLFVIAHVFRCLTNISGVVVAIIESFLEEKGAYG